MDEENATCLLDNELANEMEKFRPYWSSMDVSKPYSISKFLSLLGPGNSIVTNYMDDKTPDTGVDTIVSRLKFRDIA